VALLEDTGSASIVGLSPTHCALVAVARLTHACVVLSG